MTDEPEIDLSVGDGSTLTEVLDAYTAGGFTTQFTVTDDSQLECGACAAVSDPAAVTMSSLRRLEGESDPADMMAVVASDLSGVFDEGHGHVGVRPCVVGSGRRRPGRAARSPRRSSCAGQLGARRDDG